MLKEFREFAMKGNVLDMAVGIVVGAAFGKIVTSFVNDILTPPLGVLMGKVDFSNLFVTLSGGSFATLADAKRAGAVTLNLGLFLNSLVDFAIVAFAIFLVVKQVNRLRTPAPPPAAPALRDCPFCTSAIAVKAIRCPQCTADLKPAAV